MRRFFALCILLTLFPAVARSQTTQPTEGEQLTVLLVTVERGDEVFEKFAHNTIVILDAAKQTETVYNWGIFDFRQHMFFINYALGRMDYSMAADDLLEMVEWYKSFDRSLYAAELNLSPAQRVKLRDYCVNNDRPENRVYRYNYFTNNCSTRVRDVIDLAVDGQVKQQLSSKMTDSTFRSQTLRVTRDDPLWCTFFNVALGPATDRKISQWDECFLPALLHEHLRQVTVLDETGQRVPIIKREFTIYKSHRGSEPTTPPNWTGWYFLISVILAGAIERAGKWAQRARGGRITFSIILAIYLAFLSILALCMMWLWFASSHWAAWRNENLLAYSPIAIALLVLLPALIRRSPRRTKLIKQLSIALAISTSLALIASLILPQYIIQPLALVLPANLALAYTIRRYLRAGALQIPQRDGK